MVTALEVTMKPIRNPTPVVLITPTTIPTAAEAAPTARAYFTPVSIAFSISGISIRFCGLKTPMIEPAQSRAVMGRSKPSVRYFQTAKAMKAAGKIRVRGTSRLAAPTMTARLMPQNADM